MIQDSFLFWVLGWDLLWKDLGSGSGRKMIQDSFLFWVLHFACTNGD